MAPRRSVAQRVLELAGDPRVVRVLQSPKLVNGLVIVVKGVGKIERLAHGVRRRLRPRWGMPQEPGPGRPGAQR